MAEWSKAHAWKVCIRQRIEGSNPSLSATYTFIMMQRSPINLQTTWSSGFFYACKVLLGLLTVNYYGGIKRGYICF